MFKLSGGTKAKKGSYWNFTTGERVRLEAEGTLPGDKKDVYLRIPSGILLFFVAPFLGLAYALFLPTAAIVMMGVTVWKKIVAAFGLSTESVPDLKKTP